MRAFQLFRKRFVAPKGFLCIFTLEKLHCLQIERKAKQEQSRNCLENAFRIGKRKSKDKSKIQGYKGNFL